MPARSSDAKTANLGEAHARAKQADSRYAVDMTRTAAFAPHIGAALGAVMLLACGLAFEAGRSGLASERAAPANTPLIAVSLPRETARVLEASLENTASLENGASRENGAAADPLAAPPPRLAILIDDVGLDRQAARELLALDFPVTLSILPYADAAPEIAREARAAGRDVFLHLPMEPIGLADPGPGALSRYDDGDALSARMRWALSRVPGAIGFNNHMGSRLTADPRAMEALFDPLAQSGLIFVDSLTSAESVAAREAEEAGLKVLKRHIFLDHNRSPEAVDAAIEDALARAVRDGEALAIGHPHRVTLAALTRLKEKADAAGVALVGVSALSGKPAIEA